MFICLSMLISSLKHPHSFPKASISFLYVPPKRDRIRACVCSYKENYFNSLIFSHSFFSWEFIKQFFFNQVSSFSFIDLLPSKCLMKFCAIFHNFPSMSLDEVDNLIRWCEIKKALMEKKRKSFSRGGNFFKLNSVTFSTI